MDEKKLQTAMPQKTLEVLEMLAMAPFQKKTIQAYTLVGGTALAIHMNHRQSEDLDFFRDGHRLEKMKVFSFLRKNNIGFSVISEPSAEQMDLSIKNVKVSFFASGLNCLKSKNNIHYHNIDIASPQLITAMKVNALSQRSTIRDYYDLYVLNHEMFTLEQMYQITKDILNIGTFKLFTQQLVYTDDVQEKEMGQHLKPKFPVTLAEIKEHFQKEIKKNYQVIEKKLNQK